MKTKIKYIGLFSLLIAFGSFSSYAQLRVGNYRVISDAPNSSAFLDASSFNEWNLTPNIGKGLLYPRVDLTKFTFSYTSGVGIAVNYPTRFDGFTVYNTATSGKAAAGATLGTLSPGYWYYDNKTTDINGGTWKPVGGVIQAMTTVQRDSIEQPLIGQTIFNNTENYLNTFNGTNWISVGGPASGSWQPAWSLTGNAGTSPPVNFLGTTDNNPLVFKVNNKWAGSTGYSNNNNVSFGYLSFGNSNPLTGGNSNTAFGAQTLQYNSTGSGNVAVGTWALQYNGSSLNVAVGLGAMSGLVNGNENVAIGANSLTNNTQNYNTAVGAEAAQFTTTAEGITAIGFKTLNKNTTGEFNTALGFQALMLNTTGYWNVALGSGSLQWNSTGRFNTAGGNSSMHFNQEGVENTAFGEQALAGNLNGSYNTAVGCRSLHSVLYTPGAGDSGFGNGDANTAVGYESMKQMTTGSFNTGMGIRALLMNTTGKDNTAFGTGAMTKNTTGNRNTAIGSTADVSQSDLTNATAIGYGAIATASNQVTIGNSDVLSIRGQVGWTTISDGRVKKNIKRNVPGLAFINILNPVTYNLDLDAEDNILRAGKSKTDSLHSILTPADAKARETQQKRIRTGFVAQEVEAAAKRIGYDFSGVDADESGNGLYGLRYDEFIVPLVKAVQELSEQNNEKDSVIISMQNQIETLTGMVNKLMEKENLSHGNSAVSIPVASLEQNFPNPFNQSTTIRYTLPQTFNSAKIVVTDASGAVRKQTSVSGAGQGKVTIEAGSFTAGVYSYSLYIDNALIDTKKMIITK